MDESVFSFVFFVALSTLAIAQAKFDEGERAAIYFGMLTALIFCIPLIKSFVNLN